MAKTKSERMKEYRLRKKEKMGDKWLKRERERVSKYYTPVEQLNKKQKKERREKVRKHVQNYRERQKNETQNGHSKISLPTTEDENGVSSTCNASVATPLIVKMNFQSSHRVAGKKRVSRALAKTYREKNALLVKNKSLTKRLAMYRKRIERERKKIKSADTPKSRTDALIRKCSLSPRSIAPIRKKLLFAECLTDEIKIANKENNNKKRIIGTVACGKIVKKYRQFSTLRKTTNLTWRQNNLTENKSLPLAQRYKHSRKRQHVINDIRNFLERDDNSRILPGKDDAIKQDKDKIQKRVLNDYLQNLYLKYKSETSYTVSLATFCRYRPKYIALVNYASRSSCLCSKHQNFALKLQCLKSLGLSSVTSPDKFVELHKNEGIDSMLSNIDADKIVFKEWKRVKMPDGKERMRIVDNEVSNNEFSKVVKDDFAKFIDHVERVKLQYGEIRKMKENLPTTHAILQMDFAENYTCQHQNEIQSAYWNASMVTLHPTVAYFKTSDGTLSHVSNVFVSDVLHHNAAMVIAILRKIIPTIKDIKPYLTHVHVWTDSPTSQYRNRSIFDVVGQSEAMFGIRMSWHYFESGHGKGPCDGIGGATKRNADNAVKLGKAVLQDASDFYAWAVDQSEVGSHIKYHFVSQEMYENSYELNDVRNKEIAPIKGTMRIHAVTYINKGQVATRNTTCSCANCFDITEGFYSTKIAVGSCIHWKKN